MNGFPSSLDICFIDSSVQESIPKLSAFTPPLSIPTLIGYQKSLCFQDLFEVQQNFLQKKAQAKDLQYCASTFSRWSSRAKLIEKKSENNFHYFTISFWLFLIICRSLLDHHRETKGICWLLHYTVLCATNNVKWILRLADEPHKQWAKIPCAKKTSHLLPKSLCSPTMFCNKNIKEVHHMPTETVFARIFAQWSVSSSEFWRHIVISSCTHPLFQPHS